MSAQLLAQSLGGFPQIASGLERLTGTEGYAEDPHLRVLVHRHVLAVLAGRGDLPPSVQATAHALATRQENDPAHQRFIASAIRIRDGVATPADVRRAGVFMRGPGAVLADAAEELMMPILTTEHPPIWLAQLTPLITHPTTATALATIFHEMNGEQP